MFILGVSIKFIYLKYAYCFPIIYILPFVFELGPEFPFRVSVSKSLQELVAQGYLFSIIAYLIGGKHHKGQGSS